MTPRDGGGTQNRQKSANMTAVKKRKCKHLQKRFSSSLHVYTFNADFCTFLQSLRSEQEMNLVYSLVMLIVISNLFYCIEFDDLLLLHIRRIRFCPSAIFGYLGGQMGGQNG